MFKSTGLTTAPTQKVTWVIGACGGGDRVADGDRVVVSADQDFADDKSQDALLFVEVQLVEAVGETAEEALEGVGEFEVGVGGGQLVDREELFLVGLDQAGDGALGAGDVAFERFAASAGGVLGPQRRQAAVDLRLHERGVFEQPSDLVPDEPVELISADQAAVVEAAADVAV